MIIEAADRIIKARKRIEAGRPDPRDLEITLFFQDLLKFNPRNTEGISLSGFFMDHVLFELACYHVVMWDSALVASGASPSARTNLAIAFNVVFEDLAKIESNLWDIAQRRLSGLGEMINEGASLEKFHNVLTHHLLNARVQGFVCMDPYAYPPIFDIEGIAVKHSLINWEIVVRVVIRRFCETLDVTRPIQSIGLWPRIKRRLGFR